MRIKLTALHRPQAAPIASIERLAFPVSMLVLSHLRWDEADFAETEAKSRDLRLLPDLRMPAVRRRVFDCGRLRRTIKPLAQRMIGRGAQRLPRP